MEEKIINIKKLYEEIIVKVEGYENSSYYKLNIERVVVDLKDDIEKVLKENSEKLINLREKAEEKYKKGEIQKRHLEIYYYYNVKIFFKSVNKEEFNEFLQFTKEKMKPLLNLRFDGSKWVGKVKLEEYHKIIEAIREIEQFLNKKTKEIIKKQKR